MSTAVQQPVEVPGVPPIKDEELPDHLRSGWCGSKLLAIAVHFGLVVLGCTVRGYMTSAVENMRYCTVHIWGEQGSMKSNLTLQHGSWIYGELVHGEWHPDWDAVLKHIIFRPGKEERGLLRMLKDIPQGEREAWLGWDDLGVHFPSSSYKTDLVKYQAIDSAFAAIRTKISTLTTNNPLIDRVAKNIQDNISIEEFIGPNQTVISERLCRIPGLKSIDSHFFKVPIEDPKQFDYTLVPGDVWKEYWDLRLRIADDAIQKLDEAWSGDVDPNEWVPLYDILDQGISTPSRVLSYASRDLITVQKVGNQRYVRKADVEHILKHGAKPKEQKVSGGGA